MKIAHDAAEEVPADPEAMMVDVDELCRIAAQQMLATALLTERRVYLDA